MDIKSMPNRDDKKKKRIIIALIILFLLSLVGGVAYFLNTSKTPIGDRGILSGWEGLAPRGGTSTSTLKRLPFIELAADHPTVSPGQESTISWVASNATACVDGNGDPIDLTGSLSISPTEPYIFDVLCTGPNGTQSQTITIGVSTAPIIELIATPSSVLSGKQSYVSWNTINADRCEDSKGETLRLTGGFSIKPTAPYTYSMSCTGEKGTTKKSVTVGITTPFTGTGTSGGSTGTGIGGVGAYTDTSTGLIYNSDGTLYSGSSYGIDISGGSGVGAPASTKTNLSGKSFIVELSALANPVPFNTTTKVSWKVTNLGATGRCTILTSNNTGKPYLPIGSFSGTSLFKTVTTHPMTSSEKITLACTKGSEEIVQALDLLVGPLPPLPDPVIDSFSVVVKATPSKNYTATRSTLVAKWSINATASKIEKCDLYKNDGTTNTLIKTFLQGGSSHEFTERTPGKYVYALECSRGEDEDEKITRKTSVSPDHITIINCSYKNGFGTEDLDIKEEVGGVLSSGDKYGLPGLIVCVKEYPENYTAAVGAGKKFMELFGFDEALGGSVNSEVRKGDEQYLCPYSRYYQLGTSEVNNLDGEYRKKDNPNNLWAYVDSTPQSHSRTGTPTIWTGSSSSFKAADHGWTGANISVAAKVVCLISASADSSIPVISVGGLTESKKVTYDTPVRSRFVVPEGVTSLTIEAWGGGGGSGGTAYTKNHDEGNWRGVGGGGGAAGGYSKLTSLSVTPGQVLYVRVGAGGLVGDGSGSANQYQGRIEPPAMVYGQSGGLTQILYPKSDNTYGEITAEGGAGGRTYDGKMTRPHDGHSVWSVVYCPNTYTTRLVGLDDGTPTSVRLTSAWGEALYFAEGGAGTTKKGNPGSGCTDLGSSGQGGPITGGAGGAAVAGDNGQSAGAGGGYYKNPGDLSGGIGANGKVIIRW